MDGETTMKKIIAGALLMAAPLVAMADGAGGCGWGSMLFEGNSGLPAHVLAVTTNGSSGNNTFGMTSGTNGCTTNEKINYKGGALAAANMDKLAEEMAQGQGEHLQALAVAMGIQPQDRAAFYQLAQANFNTLYPSTGATADHMMVALHDTMIKDPTLAKYVS